MAKKKLSRKTNPKNIDKPKKVLEKKRNRPYKELLDQDTGELIEVASYTTPNQMVGYEKKVAKERSLDDYQNYTGDKFSWFNTEKVSEVSNGVSENKIRAFGAVMMLSAYLQYDDNKLPMKNLKEIADVLNLGLRQTREVISIAIDMDMIKKEDGFYYLNQSLVFRGKLQKNEVVIRAYHQAIRSLQSMSLSDVGFLFMIMPYISFDHWTICKNPECGEQGGIQPMNMIELAEATGFNRSTLTKKFSRMTFNYEGKEMSTVLYIGNPVSKRMTIIVNPILFGRKVSDNYKSIAALFNINI